MIQGMVDPYGRALMTLELRFHESSLPITIQAWIDTGFTGDLLVPGTMIDDWGLVQSGSVDAVLADGSLVMLPT